MPQCWVIGDTAVDLLPEGNQYIKCPGGTGANIAVALSRLGIDNHLVAKLGHDPLAEFLVDTLKREKVDTQHLTFSASCKTSLIIVSLDDQGEREFTFMVRPSADSQLEISDFPEFHSGDWICVSAFIFTRQPSRDATFSALEQAKEAGSIICVDANMRAEVWDDQSLFVPRTLEALKLADIAKMSAEELSLLTDTDSIEEGIEEVKRWPAKIKIITLADKGAVLLTEQSEYRIEGYAVPVVDMTGAGDAFFAAFISQLIPLESWSDDQLVKAVKFSNACGAIVVGKKGAMSALPDSETVNTFMVEQSQHGDISK